MAQDVGELADALGLARYAVLGHSYGAFVALQHAADFPGQAALAKRDYAKAAAYFERIYVMVPSGVGNATQTIVTQIYNNGFKDLNFGVASAQAFVLFLMVAAVAVIQFRFLRSDVEY